MAEFSAIEWTDSTWNPVTGCTKISPGCKFCYAERVTERWGRGDFKQITIHRDRLQLPLKWRKHRRIFVNSMSDLFHEKVPFNFIDEVFDVMIRAEQHVFQVLTKRADRMLEWTARRRLSTTIPPHVWLGVSVESEDYLWRVDTLRQIEVPIRFVSAEPLLGSIRNIDLRGISWLITGGESGGPPDRALVELTSKGWSPKAQALSWVRELRDLCNVSGVAFFHKQWGGPTPKAGGNRLDRRMWHEYPATPKVAQLALG